MSIEKSHLASGLIVAAITVLAVLPLNSQQSEDILEYYCRQAARVLTRQDPAANGLSYSFTAASVRTKLGRKGRIDKADSGTVEYFISGETADSAKTVAATSKWVDDIALDYPNVFIEPYRHRFFPNDTGGELAIGFEDSTAADTLPTGLALIDRHDYTLQRLYLFYPEREGYRRYSRIYYFGEHDGYRIPDSMVVQYTLTSILSDKHYRSSITISDFTIR